MWDERVNTAIDEVARQMTEGSPAGSADFRRRVLARVESGDAPRAAWRAAFVLSPLAVAAAIVVAVVVARGSRIHDVSADRHTPGVSRGERAAPQETQIAATGPQEAPGPSQTGQPAILVAQGLPASARVPNERATARLAETPEAQRRQPREGGPERAALQQTAIGGESRASALQLEALAARPLDVAPLRVHALTPDPIQIERLDTISPISVAPLDITDVQRRYE